MIPAIKDLFDRHQNTFKILAALVTLFGLSKAVSLIRKYQSRKKQAQIEQIAKIYQEERNKRVKALDIPTPEELKISKEKLENILNSSALQLTYMLQRGEVTSENLVNIFSFRCQTIGMEYGAITEMNYEEAILIARECDKILSSLRDIQNENSADSNVLSSSQLSLNEENEAEQPRNQGNHLQCNQAITELYAKKPLFGIPVSIKDIIEMKGFAVTLGCVSRKDNIVKEDTLIIRLIKNSGAIPFVRSNIPQLNMASDCTNRLFGRTCNAWDKSRYSGGSSGGEAVLLATRCSPLGFGSDIGGSTRIPAGFNGVAGFKPTSGRTPFKGLGFASLRIAGQLAIRTTVGPMSRFVDDIALGMLALTDSQYISQQKATQKGAFQPRMHTFDLNKYNDQTKKYRIGYFKSLDLIEACPAQQKAVEIAVEALRQKGHEVIEIDMPFVQELTELFYSIINSDNYKRYFDQLGDEEFIEEYIYTKMLSRMNYFEKKILLWKMRQQNQLRTSNLLEKCIAYLSSEDFLTMCGKLQIRREEVIKFFEDSQIEALITPSQPVPAFNHGKSGSIIMLGAVYTHLWNTLNFTAGVIPTGLIEENEQIYTICKHNDKVTQLIQSSIKTTKGLPLSAQVVTLPYEEELCLNLMKQIEDTIQFYNHHSSPI